MFVVAEFLEGYPRHRAALRAALVLHAHAMLAAHPACQHFDVSQDEIDGNSFLLYQRYESKAVHLALLDLPDTGHHRALVDPWILKRRTLTFELVSDAGVA